MKKPQIEILSGVFFMPLYAVRMFFFQANYRDVVIVS